MLQSVVGSYIRLSSSASAICAVPECSGSQYCHSEWPYIYGVAWKLYEHKALLQQIDISFVADALETKHKGPCDLLWRILFRVSDAAIDTQFFPRSDIVSYLFIVYTRLKLNKYGTEKVSIHSIDVALRQ